MDNIKEISLNEIKITGKNIRQNVEVDQDFIASIEAKGVLQPIIVRPSGKIYELVAGERRLRAKIELAKKNGGIAKSTIPAIVKELTDDEAFEVMTIENLQRESLSPLEEARAINAHIEKHKAGADRIEDLADKIGKTPQWVRRRIGITDLPEKVLALWDKGEIGIGHLEQLLRVRENEKLMARVVSLIVNDGYPVAKIDKWITENSTNLKSAKFDKTECAGCPNNTEKQFNLFGLGDDKARCQNPTCFGTKLVQHIAQKWEGSKWQKEHGTKGATIEGEYLIANLAALPEGPDDECRECDSFVSAFNLSGACVTPLACVNKECASKKYDAQWNKKMKKDSDAKEPKKERKEGEPRVAWHGMLFRERFFAQELPRRAASIDPAAPEALHAAAFALVKAHRDNHAVLVEFCNERGIKHELSDHGFNEDENLFAPIKGLVPADTLELIKRFSMGVIMTHDHFGRGFKTTTRDVIAEHFGIDVKRDFVITQDYLESKSKGEILAILDQMPKAKRKVIEERMLKGEPGAKFESQKKAKLINLIMGSGVDLSGCAPPEIVDYNKKVSIPSAKKINEPNESNTD